MAFGATPWQVLRRVQLPLARPTIMAGLNQTIMMSLSMVVIAALIGAGGLGVPVFHGLNTLEVGLAGIGGLSIVLLAMVLDRITQALAKNVNNVRPSHRAVRARGFWIHHNKGETMQGKNVLFRLAVTLILVCSLSTLAFASYEKPGEGVTVHPGRATWTTGHFQELLVRLALEELGYDVKKPKDLSNPIFYQAVTMGDIDYWTNAWFPLHYDQLPKNFDEKAEAIGFIAKAGGLSGYLASKKAVDEFGITSLADFKRQEVMKAFDANGDGKADMVALRTRVGVRKSGFPPPGCLRTS